MQYQISMDSIKTRAFNEHFTMRILSSYGIAPEMIKNHPEFQNIRNYAVVSPWICPDYW